MTVYAYFANKDKLTVTFYDADGETVLRSGTVSYNGKLSDVTGLADPTATGKTFVKWRQIGGIVNGKTAEIKNTPVTGSVSFLAVYDESKVTLKFNVGASTDTIPDVTCTYGDSYNLIQTAKPTDAALTFDGWFDKASGGNPVTTWDATADLTVYAHYASKEALTVNFLNASFGEIATLTVPYGKKISESETSVPTAPAIAGKTFGVWRPTDGTSGVAADAIGNVTVTKSLIYVAEYTDNLVTLTFNNDAGNGEAPDPIANRAYGDDYAITQTAEINDETQEFDGWYTSTASDGKRVTTWDAKLSVTVYAKFKAKGTAVVTFDSAGGSTVTEKTVILGQSVGKPTDPTKEGYAFQGWRFNGEDYDFSAPVNGNLKLTAVWTKNALKVTATGYDGVYDGAYHGIRVTYPDGAEVAYSDRQDGTYTAENPVYRDAGLRNVWYRVTKADAIPATGFATVNISRKEVTISGIAAANKPHDGTTDATLIYTGVQFDGAVNGDNLTVYGVGTFENAEIGEGKTVAITNLTLGGGSADNYRLADSGQQTATTADIAPNPLRVFATGWSGAYDGEPHGISVSAADGAEISYSESENGVYTADNPAYQDAGNYTVYYKVTKSGSADTTGCASVVIGKADIIPTLKLADRDNPNMTKTSWPYGGPAGIPNLTVELARANASLLSAILFLFVAKDRTITDYSMPIYSYKELSETAYLPYEAEKLEALPVGAYVLRADVPESKNYNAASAEVNFNIVKAAHDSVVTTPVTVLSNAENLSVDLGPWLADGAVCAVRGAGGSLLRGTPTVLDGALRFSTGDGEDGSVTVTVSSPNYETYAITVHLTAGSAFKLQFDGNGGEAVAETRNLRNGTPYGTLPVVTRTGYTLDGWYTAAQGGTRVTPETTMGGADTTLYAHWTAVNYTVVFHLDDGTTWSSQTVRAGGKADRPDANPTKDGYQFAGWHLEGSGAAFDFDAPVTENTDLYASWTRKATPAPSGGGGGGGSYSGGGGGSGSSERLPTVKVNEKSGGQQTVTPTSVAVKPANAWRVAAVTVNGTAVTVNGTPVTLPEDGKIINLTYKDTVEIAYDKIPVAPARTLSGDAESDPGPAQPAQPDVEPAQPADDTQPDGGTTDTGPRNPFTDVAEGRYYYDAVLWATGRGITNGRTATLFDPNSFCTRAQTVAFLWRAAGEPEPTSVRNPFTDIREIAYYYKAVLWAAEQGITKGTTATTFSPELNCSRAQIVTFLYRYFNGSGAESGNG